MYGSVCHDFPSPFFSWGLYPRISSFCLRFECNHIFQIFSSPDCSYYCVWHVQAMRLQPAVPASLSAFLVKSKLLAFWEMKQHRIDDHVQKNLNLFSAVIEVQSYIYLLVSISSGDNHNGVWRIYLINSYLRHV